MAESTKDASWTRDSMCVGKQRRAGRSGGSECTLGVCNNLHQGGGGGELPATFRLGHQDDFGALWHFGGLIADTVNIVPHQATGTDVSGVVTLGTAHHGSTLRARECLPFNGTGSFPSRTKTGTWGGRGPGRLTWRQQAG